MSFQQASTLTGCKAVATLAKTALVNAKVRLFKSGFHPTPANVQADFIAQECDFDGYAAVTIAAWGDIVLASAQAGYLVLGVNCVFLWALAVDAVENMVGGFWVETAAGVVWQYQEFADAVPMQGPDQSTAFTPVFLAATNLISQL